MKTQSFIRKGFFMIAMLEQRTRELKALSIEILNLAKRAAEWLRI